MGMSLMPKRPSRKQGSPELSLFGSISNIRDLQRETKIQMNMDSTTRLQTTKIKRECKSLEIELGLTESISISKSLNLLKNEEARRRKRNKQQSRKRELNFSQTEVSLRI